MSRFSRDGLRQQSPLPMTCKLDLPVFCYRIREVTMDSAWTRETNHFWARFLFWGQGSCLTIHLTEFDSWNKCLLILLLINPIARTQKFLGLALTETFNWQHGWPSHTLGWSRSLRYHRHSQKRLLRQFRLSSRINQRLHSYFEAAKAKQRQCLLEFGQAEVVTHCGLSRCLLLDAATNISLSKKTFLPLKTVARGSELYMKQKDLGRSMTFLRPPS